MSFVYFLLLAGAQGYAAYRYVFVHKQSLRRALWFVPGFFVMLVLSGVSLAGMILNWYSLAYNLLLVGGLAIAAVTIFAMHMVAPGKGATELARFEELDERERRRQAAKLYGYHPVLLSGSDQK